MNIDIEALKCNSDINTSEHYSVFPAKVKLNFLHFYLIVSVLNQFSSQILSLSMYTLYVCFSIHHFLNRSTTKFQNRF